MTGTPLPPPPLFNNGKKVENPDVFVSAFKAALIGESSLNKDNHADEGTSSREETVTPEIETRKSRAAKKEKNHSSLKELPKTKYPIKFTFQNKI